SINEKGPANPSFPESCELGHACAFGLGAIGSACTYVLGCLPKLEISLDLVDMDHISPSNEERLFISAHPKANRNLPKVLAAQRFIKDLHPSVDAFAYIMPFERFVEAARERLGYVWCCLDSGPLRRTLQTELTSVMVNGGTDLSRWMLSLHEFDRLENACLNDLYPEPRGLGFNPEVELANYLGLPVEVIRHLARSGRIIDPDLIEVVAGRRKDRSITDDVGSYAGLRFDQAVERMCSTMQPDKALPAATISFVSLMPAVFMVADLIKRRVYGWSLPKGGHNVFQFDALRLPDQGTVCNILASRNCLCQSERYSKAYRERQQLRSEYLRARFASRADPWAPPLVARPRPPSY
ncbi:MAG: ThiF family adenylyltransferase, partial [Deltaproteobacteria bacterium]|nr:ThiF family adenylyltransferase [Deltaproteobacteria bacterium]